MKRITPIGSLIASAALLASCGSTDETPKAPTAEEVAAVLKASFGERGVAKVDRLDQSEIQRLCSAANASNKDLDKPVRERLEKASYAAIKYPADGSYIGDWKEGERIAQNGRGLQFSDAAGSPNGANCYACHQVSPSEISYGNQGPSLLKYGAIRGVKDPRSKEAEAMVKYTWGRIYNTHAFNACSNMPRFGEAGILTEAQMKHVMALLLDPESPVNK